MKRTQLGNDGPYVSAIGLGCMGLSGVYGDVSENQAIATIHAALDHGINLFNTAAFYGRGENERLLGRVLKDRRDEVVVATKIGIRPDDKGRPTVVDAAPKYIREACDESLLRLDCERIDVVILARVDTKVPIEESVGTLGELVASGKVGRIGLSEASAATIRRAHAVAPLAVVETEYSLWQRHVEVDIMPELRRLGISLMAYSPLGRGYLTGEIDSEAAFSTTDIRRHQPRFSPRNFKSNACYVESLTRIATRTGITPSQVALAWLLARGPQVIPIPGTTKPEHVIANAVSVGAILSEEDMEFLSSQLPREAIGDRYPPGFMTALDR